MARPAPRWSIDTLTGENKVLRTDILHDVGRSLNPAIDIGQIEGGFVQGMGWLTTEELVYDQQGRLRTHAPSTYKIPVASDVPADFRVSLFDGANREERSTVRRRWGNRRSCSRFRCSRRLRMPCIPWRQGVSFRWMRRRRPRTF